MAQAAKQARAPRKAKAFPTVDAAPLSADDLKNDAVQDAVDNSAAAANAAKAEAEANEAKRQEALNSLRGRIADEVNSLTEGDKTSALDARLHWVNIGNLLIEGRDLFTTPGKNTVNTKAFGDWIEKAGFRALGARPTRSSAIWLSEVYNHKPDLYALFPTESENGEPLRRSPRTLQAWVTGEIYEAFQNAWEADADGVAVASEAEEGSRADVAKASMENVHKAIGEEISALETQRDAANEAMKAAKNPADRAKASESYNTLAGMLDMVARRKDILEQHTTAELTEFFVKWKPKQKNRSFKDCEAEEAAGRLFALLKTHPEFGAVYDALGVMVEELQSKVDADAGAVDTDAGADADAGLDAGAADAAAAGDDGIVDSGPEDDDFEEGDFEEGDFEEGDDEEGDDEEGDDEEGDDEEGDDNANA